MTGNSFTNNEPLAMRFVRPEVWLALPISYNWLDYVLDYRILLYSYKAVMLDFSMKEIRTDLH